MLERRSTRGPQDATIGIGRSADELLRAARERCGEPRAAEYGPNRASGADAKLHESARGNSTLDTPRGITTRPEARSRDNPSKRSTTESGILARDACTPTPLYDIFHFQSVQAALLV